MDFDKYYKLDSDGGYTLHFLNKDKLSTPEIRKIFSVYGNVLALNNTKDEGGFRFIKYKTLQEIEACVQGLQDGRKIQLLPEKSKLKDKKMNRTDSIQNENLNNEGNNSDKNFNENNRSDNFSDTSQYFMHNHKPIPNGIKENLSVDGKSSLFPRQQTSMENKSSDMIDYEKYYRLTKDGNYSVHFANKKGLPLELIKNLFSPYGTIISIYGTGNSLNGLRFVTYGKLEEVENCLKGLQNSHLISLLPQKDKKAEIKTDQNGSYQWQVARSEDTSQKTFSPDIQFNVYTINSNSTHNESNKQEKFSEHREKPVHNTKASDWNKFEGADKFSDIDYNSQHYIDHKSNTDKIKYRNTSSNVLQTFSEKYSSPRPQKPINNEDYNQLMRKKQEETKYSSMKTETDSKTDRNKLFNTHHKMPMLISDMEMKPKESDVMSNSSVSNETSNSKIVCIPMQEIIVANIHKNYGVHYILHLFEKYSPISATVVKTISKTNIRYCHIYFKTVQDAEAIEEEFDNFDLFGMNLIVLRKSRLIDDETICK